MHRVFPRALLTAAPVPAVSPEAARAIVDRQNGLILDVREPDEWAEASIPGAKHIPLGEIMTRHTEVPRDRPVILQCRSGARSEQATRALLDLGFTNVQNLMGGITDWAADGLPLQYGGR